MGFLHVRKCISILPAAFVVYFILHYLVYQPELQQETRTRLVESAYKESSQSLVYGTRSKNAQDEDIKTGPTKSDTPSQPTVPSTQKDPSHSLFNKEPPSNGIEAQPLKIPPLARNTFKWEGSLSDQQSPGERQILGQNEQWFPVGSDLDSLPQPDLKQHLFAQSSNLLADHLPAQPESGVDVEEPPMLVNGEPVPPKFKKPFYVLLAPEEIEDEDISNPLVRRSPDSEHVDVEVSQENADQNNRLQSMVDLGPGVYNAGPGLGIDQGSKKTIGAPRELLSNEETPYNYRDGQQQGSPNQENPNQDLKSFLPIPVAANGNAIQPPIHQELRGIKVPLEGDAPSVLRQDKLPPSADTKILISPFEEGSNKIMLESVQLPEELKKLAPQLPKLKGPSVASQMQQFIKIQKETLQNMVPKDAPQVVQGQQEGPAASDPRKGQVLQASESRKISKNEPQVAEILSNQVHQTHSELNKNSQDAAPPGRKDELEETKKDTPLQEAPHEIPKPQSKPEELIKSAPDTHAEKDQDSKKIDPIFAISNLKGNTKVKQLYEPGFMNPQMELCPNNGRYLKVLMLITTAPDHERQRNAIRQTWGHFSMRKDIAMGFMVGRTSRPEVQTLIDRENERYGDIIEGKFVDHYDNLTLKTMAMFEWAKTYCSESRFILKTDDDMFINVPLLLAFIKTKDKEKRAIFGRLAKGWKPVRNTKSKYYVDVATYNRVRYPEFLTGPAYLMTNDVVDEIYQTALDTIFFFLEDVLLTGFVSEYLKIKRVGDSHFRNSKIKLTDTCQLMQSISIHMVTYDEQFDVYKRTLDGKTKCKIR